MILCVTHSNDTFTIDRVLNYFDQIGEPALRFNTDEYLSNITISQVASGHDTDMKITVGDVTFSANDIKGVWFRKLWTPKIINEVHESYRENTGAEIQSTLFNFFNYLERKVPCINVLSNDLKVAKDKYNQLEVAVKYGLSIPKTVITSDWGTLKRFFERNGKDIIVKLQNSLSFSLNKGKRFFPTTKITSDNLPQFKNTLGCCPMIFQENISKEYELRIAYVGGVFFTGKINATETKNGQTDWRNATIEETYWNPYQLPEEIREKLSQLMEELELSFGAIDLIKTPKGKYVFLEVNPSGEWGMLERYLNYPIAETIAETLLKKTAVNA